MLVIILIKLEYIGRTGEEVQNLEVADGQEFKGMKTFMYLRFILTKHEETDEEINNRLQKRGDALDNSVPYYGITYYKTSK